MGDSVPDVLVSRAGDGDTPDPAPAAAPAEPWRLTFDRARARMAEGSLTAQDLIGAASARIAEVEPSVRAWAHLHPAPCVPPCATHPAPLLGMPVGIKDLIDTFDLPTECGSPVHRGRRPDSDAAAVALLRRAGAVVMGKTVTDEMGYGWPGPTRNPHAPGHTPGGSSAGSAAAVAAGMVPVALATQTAGSTILPAALCGVLGYVASAHDISLRGVQPLSVSFDAPGVMARSVADIRAVRDVLLGSRLRRPPTLPARPTLALWSAASVSSLAPEMAATLRSAADALERAGAIVVEPEIADLVEMLTGDHEIVMAFEAARSLCWESAVAGELSTPLGALIERGWSISDRGRREAMVRIAFASATLAQRLGSVDAILAPAADGPASAGSQATGAQVHSRPWQAVGRPAIALPVAASPAGVPLGIQLVGHRFEDDDLLALADWACGRMLPWPGVAPIACGA